MDTYRYTQEWFMGSELRHYLKNFLDNSTENRILEIGCFEGLSSVFFADNFLVNPKSILTCVDPFLSVDNDHSAFLQKDEEKNFDFNLSVCKNQTKIIIHKITSDMFFKYNNRMYNFIYIDGCHEVEYIQRDMENSFNALDKDGIMWMDDYRGGDGLKLKAVMDNWLEEYNGKYTLIHSGYQLAIKKL